MMEFRLLAICTLRSAAGFPTRADEGIQWRHRATQGAVTLTANPLTPAARIAFLWAQFQAESTFEPGDGIMGMATLETASAWHCWRSHPRCGRKAGA